MVLEVVSESGILDSELHAYPWTISMASDRQDNYISPILSKVSFPYLNALSGVNGELCFTFFLHCEIIPKSA